MTANAKCPRCGGLYFVCSPGGPVKEGTCPNCQVPMRHINILGEIEPPSLAAAKLVMKRAFDDWRDALKAADVKKEAYSDAHGVYLALLNAKEEKPCAT